MKSCASAKKQRHGLRKNLSVEVTIDGSRMILRLSKLDFFLVTGFRLHNEPSAVLALSDLPSGFAI